MNQSKGLSAIGYLSFYFAPFIIPVIIFFITKDEFVRTHAKRAFISHLIPIILGIIYIIIFFISAFIQGTTLVTENFFLSSFFIGLIVLAAISIIIAIWNLVQAIKVLK